MPNFDFPLDGYSIRRGSTLDKALLVKFIQRTYQELFPTQDFSHLACTVEQYFSTDTPLWWVYETQGTGNREQGTEGRRQEAGGKYFFPVTSPQSPVPNPQSPIPNPQSPVPIACLWAGNAIDQVTGDRHAHIFLLYVVPSHRRRGIAKALMQHIENWAKQRGDRQIGLQVFTSNTPALNLYQNLGYQTQSLWMIKFIR
ncbi:GNAT family N-acetyltransferase [Sphaerospermopsis kisseleviana CS-549]|uniref:GNAT family N-acetyltransferase n=1 Tax=Sphaerospermopsis kisseleviana CS-549 TaxID=3021783 RepID=A0ABT4ZSF1_9CYAN|nr:GNAT family N-acetyltransferase [Sphaerospermopsis kisseleviana]MDB9442315.1 GNAT family N-acetyltransferase [Sphaerospermopsis kisseleviana CS-549]BAZ80559.1 GCN5-like N-acetyltransferase [Sphaerospermopsis kisseleviana NIES-73]